MQYALLGNTGLTVSRLAFGAMTFTAGNKAIGLTDDNIAQDRAAAQALGNRVNR